MFPFLSRELVTALRRPSRYKLMAVLVGLAWLLTVLVWWVVSWQQFEFQKDMLSRTIFIAMSYLQLLVGCAVGFWAAGSIAGERERETWDLLATIPTRTVRMVFEKISGHIVAVVLLMASFIPFLGLCFLLGGVGPDEIVSVYAVIGSFILVSTCMGVACSAWSREEAVALRRFAVGLFLYVAVLPFFYLLFAEMNHIRFVQPVAMSPLVTMFLLHIGEKFPYGPNWTGIGWLDFLLLSPWKTHLIISLGMILLLLRVAYVPFQKQKRREQVQERPAIKPRSFIPWERIASPFDDGRNIITQHERLIAGRRRWGRSGFQFLWMTGFCVLFAFSMYRIFRQDARGGWVTIVYPIFLIGTLLASTASSGSIAGEKRRGTWDILCTTLLDPYTILEGKYEAAIRRTMKTIGWFSVYLIAVAFFIAPDERYVAGSRRNNLLLWPQRPWLIPIAILFVGSWMMHVALGLYYSVSSKSPTVAQIKTFVAVLVHLIATLFFVFVLAILDDVLRMRLNLERNDFILYTLFSFSPLGLMAELSPKFGPWTGVGAVVMMVHGFAAYFFSVLLFRHASRKLLSTPEGGTAS